MTEPLILTRDELHQLVWQIPMIQLAKQYGLSDRGLAKICDRMQIPVPGRGYWAKLYSGAKSHSKPLKKASKSCQEVVRLYERKEEPKDDMNKKKDLLELQKIFAELSTNTTHKLVEATKKRLENVESDDNGILATQTKRCLDIRVSNACMDRALNLLNMLFAVLEQRGFSIEIKEEKNSAKYLTCLKLAGEEVQIYIKENLNSTPHILTQAEKKQITKQKSLFSKNTGSSEEWDLYFWKPPKRDYHLSGQLQFKINNVEYSGLRQNWSDSTDRKLESLLPTIAYHIIQSATYLKNRTLEREAQKQLRAEEEKQRAEFERQRLEEQNKIDHLDKLIDKWSKREKILQFLAWIDNNVLIEERTESFTEWYEWAMHYAQKLNPLGE